ncbi:PEGA domain-containing protein [Sorangium sp. So ce1099]|uniref:PEGA domain-containing protein n=1 Tax=Sorangium sp. So ce1099 TaxID=3133331 RepID=UPI003F5FE501
MAETTTSPLGKHCIAAPSHHPADARGGAGLTPRMRAVAALAFAAAVALGGPAARAQQQPPRDPVAAEALFKAARALVGKGDYAAGCPKFEASLELNPSASTMINIARCHEREGKVATAWHDYNRAIVLNRETAGEQRRRGLEEIAQKGIADLDARVPKLSVMVKSAPAGVEVQRDGTPVPAAALGEPLPVDPGPHEIRASAPGHEAETRSVTLREGESVTVELTLRPAAGPPAATGPTAATGPEKASEAPGGGIPTWAWVSGAAGIALVGASVGFLIDDLSAIGALRDNCREVTGGTYCKPGYDFAADNARKNRDFGLFVGLGGAGLVALGAAAYGIAGSGGEKASAPAAAALPWVAPSGAGASIYGSF